MRRLGLLTVVALVALTTVALAVDNTLTYTAKLGFSGTPTSKKPANLTYTGVLHIDTNPAGQQPESAPLTSVYFAKGIKNNSKYFPFCNKSEIDGQASLPAKCKRAIVGSGTATALAGAPGNPNDQSVKENLTVTVINGPSGKYLYLVLNSAPDAPVGIQNRVVQGTVKASSGGFAFLVQFLIPPDLQEQLGLAISLTDFFVKINGTPKKVKVGTAYQKIGYLQLTSCKSRLPVKAIAQFKDKDDAHVKPVTSTSAAKC